MTDALRLGTISLITKCRKNFWRKLFCSKSTEIKTTLQVTLYFVGSMLGPILRSMFSNPYSKLSIH